MDDWCFLNHYTQIICKPSYDDGPLSVFHAYDVLQGGLSQKCLKLERFLLVAAQCFKVLTWLLIQDKKYIIKNKTMFINHKSNNLSQAVLVS